MPAKRRQREPCKECIARNRPCEGLYSECDYYRRSVPTKAALAAEEASGTKPHRYFLEQHVKKLEEKLERLTEEASSTSNLSVGSRAVSKSPSPAVELPPRPFHPRPAEMTGRWWEPEVLAPAVRDYLVGITLAFADEDHLYFHYPSFLASLAEPPDSPQAPHRALLEAMYLVACYYTSMAFPNPNSPYSLVRLENHFLARARKAQTDSLAWCDRLMDYLKGTCLVTGYFIKRGRYLEGYHHQCGASRMALSCGLHQIVSPIFDLSVQPTLPPALAGQEKTILLPPPANQIELADRIMCFWGIYLRDKVASVVTGFPPALNEDQDGIVAVLPRPAAEYETDDLRPQDIESIMDVFKATPSGTSARATAAKGRPDSHFTSHIKGMALYERARTLINMEQKAPERFNQGDVAVIHGAIKVFLESLPPVRDAIEEGLPFWSSLISAHTFGLGALLELKDRVTQGEQVSAAMQISRLIVGMPEQESLKGCCVYGHCWAAGAEALVAHRQRLVAQRASQEEITEVDGCLARLMAATKKLSGAYPNFAFQLNHVQRLMEMTSVSE
ncbi:hypothetical protein M407DRAFT_28503 [Tulasnella calospora MUT 4182]|uniref:Xylanolytic transcriptional activator regulatory domain-containing protein n=1 Tax=Tulasnella calospora MUT 4182 TaxID=1051891 RepID=A0A0C3LKS1_9AGAM|nr:hypothetical protein M407DRAFT_28503 [Tulasnella calospora MUT 4182]